MNFKITLRMKQNMYGAVVRGKKKKIEREREKIMD